MKISANMYTIAYFSFMKVKKEKFKLKSGDQADIFYRAVFLFFIQMVFIVLILQTQTFDLTYHNDLAVNLCMFFTVLLLHWQCVPEARNGMYMMKYAVVCPEEFNHPIAAFILGLMNTVGILLTEMCNLMKAAEQKTPTNVINKFLGFSLMLSIPKLLHGSMEFFEVSKSVGKLTLKKSRKAMLAQQDRPAIQWLLNFVYCIFKWFFISFYFYFFPFMVIFMQLVKITYMYKLQQ